MSRGKQSAQKASVGQNSQNTIGYLVKEDDDDDDRLVFLPSDDNRIQVRSANASTSGGGHLAETTVPNFLLKLWKLVEDPNYAYCIGWDESGSSFHVKEPYAFSRDVLPLFFKHSNLNSFIRQLNMYGFRKVTNLEQGALKHQAPDMASLEFHHQYFVRGHPEFLQHIKRKSTTSKFGGDLVEAGDAGGPRRLNQALDEIRQLREKQLGMDAKLHQVKRENEDLWREMAHMRQMHLKQQQVVNKLIQFLMTVVQPASGGRVGKRTLLAIGPEFFNQQGGHAPNPPSKRMRMNSDDAVDIIESLEQELRNRPPAARPRSDSTYSHGSASAGPTIADITEEELEPDIHANAFVNNAAVGGLPIIDPATSSASQGDLGLFGTIMQEPQTSMTATDPDPLANLVSPDAFFVQQPPTTITTEPQGAASQVWETGDAAEVPYYVNSAVPTPQNRRESASSLLSPQTTVPENDANDWSKPEFSQYLDYVQADLDSLKDFLTSEGLEEIEPNVLKDVFTTAEGTKGGDIVGNEVQVYKPPEILVDFDFGDAVSTSAAPSSASTSMTTASLPLSGGLGVTQQYNPPVFAMPTIPEQQQTPIFDPLGDDFFNADPIVSASPQNILTTPIMSPAVSQTSPLAQPRRGNGISNIINRYGAELRSPNQVGTSGSVTTTPNPNELLRSPRSKVGKKR